MIQSMPLASRGQECPATRTWLSDRRVSGPRASVARRGLAYRRPCSPPNVPLELPSSSTSGVRSPPTSVPSQSYATPTSPRCPPAPPVRPGSRYQRRRDPSASCAAALPLRARCSCGGVASIGLAMDSAALVAIAVLDSTAPATAVDVALTWPLRIERAWKWPGGEAAPPRHVVVAQRAKRHRVRDPDLTGRTAARGGVGPSRRRRAGPRPQVRTLGRSGYPGPGCERHPPVRWRPGRARFCAQPSAPARLVGDVRSRYRTGALTRLRS